MKGGSVLLGVVQAVAMVTVAGAQEIKTYKWDGKVPVPDGGSAFVDIEVDDEFAEIVDLEVDLIIEHTWQGDLTIELEHLDSGRKALLMDRPGEPEVGGFGFSEDNIGNPVTGEKFTFDDDAAFPYDFGSPGAPVQNPVGGWLPDTDPLSIFDGDDKHGTWRLTVIDFCCGDSGSILNFGLQIVNIPEPAALWLLGICGLAAMRRRRARH